MYLIKFVCYYIIVIFMNEKELINYYNKFNEDKRLTTKHGQVEFLTAIKYIEKYLKDGDKILDIGAGTGKYSIYFKNKGYDVEAVELVKHNLKVIEKNNVNIKTYLANATNLSMIKDDSFDIVLLFGPMYHLISMKQKIDALREAKRIVKNDGYIFISYCMNEYAVLTHGFIEGYIKDSIKNNLIDKNYHIISKSNDLYSYVRLDEINYLKDTCKLNRINIISQDGATEYLKKIINKMDEETFKIYLNYHFKTCERKSLLESSRHILDILTK